MPRRRARGPRLVQGIAEHAVHEAFHFRGIQNDPEAALQHVYHGREIP